MKKIVVKFIIFFVIISPAYSQGEIDDEEKVFYRNENTFAVSLSTNSYGIDYRLAKRLDGYRKTLYETELLYFKHDKNHKLSPSQQIGNSFVYGKLNSFISIHLGIGFQKELFRKQDKGGISIRYFYTVGPTLGFEKPMYYDFIIGPTTKRMKFEKDNQYLINNKAPFYVGVSETKLVPGIYGKIGFTFEYSKKDVIFNALETGVCLDAYIRTIEIMASAKNNSLFPGFFISYRFGKIVDSQFKNRKTKVDEIFLN